MHSGSPNNMHTTPPCLYPGCSSTNLDSHCYLALPTWHFSQECQPSSFPPHMELVSHLPLYRYSTVYICFRVSVTIIKHHSQKQTGEGRAYFLLYFRVNRPELTEVRAKNWRQALMLQRPVGSSAYWLYSYDLRNLSPRISYPRVAPPPVSWGPLPSITNQ